MALGRHDKEALDIICNIYNKTQSNEIYLGDAEIPHHIQLMLQGISKSLERAGIITEPTMDITGGWDLSLTPEGMEYCRRQTSFRNRENALSKESEYLLEELLNTRNPVELAQFKFENISDSEDTILRGAFNELEKHEFITTLWGGDVPAELVITKAGHDYMKNKREFVEMQAPFIDKVVDVPQNDVDMNKVFIVHGRDNAAKSETARFLEHLDLNAIILNEQPGKGNTIIEKIEENADVGFAIILYTPCDQGRLREENKELKDRARQNVIFEHGYFCAKIGRNRVAALVKGDIETPSDISGIEYIAMDDAGAWQYRVAKELKAAGYNIDLNKLT